MREGVNHIKAFGQSTVDVDRCMCGVGIGE